MIPATFEYFRNDEIDRTLSAEGINAVMEYLVRQGNATWDDRDKSRARIVLKSEATVAAEIYKWVMDNSRPDDDVYTFDELHEELGGSGDLHQIERALVKLECEGKCTVFAGASGSGVKFKKLT